MGNLLIGSYTAKLDKSGRVKIPEKFRSAIEEEYGKDVFITSLTDDSVHVYPLSVWTSLSGVTNEGTVHFRPDVRSFMLRVNRRGQGGEIDGKGRVLITQSLREQARLQGEVIVVGMTNHLEIWDKELLDERLRGNPLSDKDFESIARVMSPGKEG
jgi:MraZ protein